MGFSLPKLKIPSTLTKVVKKQSLEKYMPALAIVAPVGVLAYQVIEHPDKVKSTLASAAKEVKKAAPVVASTIGKAGKAVGGAASAGFNAIMMPLMLVGGLVVAIMVLKK
jgi:hypothetical protein